MSYDLIRRANYSLDHPEGKSLSVQSPLYLLKTQIAEIYLGESLEVYRSGVGSDNFDDNTFKTVIT